MKNAIRILLIASIAQLAVASAFAEISIRLTNEQLTEQSDVIVIGRATDFTSRWVDRTLVTAVTIETAETLKGSAPGNVEVILPGGVDANRKVPIAMTYAGAPQMRSDEEVLLFLTYDADLAGYVVTGFAQGKFSIVTQQGNKMVSRDLRGSQLVEGPGISRGTVTLTPLSEFRREIAGYVAR